jgi:RNA polymerase sigma-70 factor (ECF subfamily)
MSPEETYFQHVINSQTQLYAYILTLLADTAAADDVLQETNLVLCRKMKEFEANTNFEAWAFRIARFQCMAYWKTRSRDRMVLDEAAMAHVAGRAEAHMSGLNDRLTALRDCLGELTDHQRELLENRYAVGGSIKKLSDQLNRPAASLSQTLYRIRSLLLDCVRNKLREQEMPSS